MAAAVYFVKPIIGENISYELALTIIAKDEDEASLLALNHYERDETIEGFDIEYLGLAGNSPSRVVL